MFATIQKKQILNIALGTITLLSIPFIAMQFSKEVQWGILDFTIIGILLFCTGLVYTVISSKYNSFTYKAGVALAAVTGLFLVWINLAVEIIGDNNLVNLLYIGVLAIPIFGSLATHFNPRGIARALYTTAGAQMLVPTLAIRGGTANFSPGVTQVFLINGIFAALWITSGLLIQRSDRK